MLHLCSVQVFAFQNCPNNSLRVKCMGRGSTHEEVWDDLATTEIAFSTGEYKMLEAKR